MSFLRGVGVEFFDFYTKEGSELGRKSKRELSTKVLLDLVSVSEAILKKWGSKI